MHHSEIIKLTESRSNNPVYVIISHITGIVEGKDCTHVWVNGGNRFNVNEPAGDVLVMIQEKSK